MGSGSNPLEPARLHLFHLLGPGGRAGGARPGSDLLLTLISRVILGLNSSLGLTFVCSTLLMNNWNLPASCGLSQR